MALAVAVGAFAGCTPAVGFHGGLAVAGASLLRLNRLWAFVGSRVSNFLVFPWIVMAEIQLAHRARSGSWVSLTRENVLSNASALLADWCLGSIAVGAVVAVFCGALAHGWASARAHRARRARP